MNTSRSIRLGAPVLAVVVLLATGLLTSSCVSGEDDHRKPVIRLHDLQSESSWVNNAIAEFIIENGYGYPVETVVESTPVMMEALPRGEIDVNLEGWQQNIIDWYDEQIAAGTIVSLGANFEGGPQYFVIPAWVADEHGIRTVYDMKDHWELFLDPLDPSKGVFYNCISGWQCAEINAVKLGAYGLDQYYNAVSPASSVALHAALSEGQDMHRPVFGYYWAPTALMGAYDWHVLEEPPYSAACWEKVTAASTSKSLRPIDEACAYETLPVDKLAYDGLEEKARDVMEMLRRMNVGLDPLTETLAWADENEVEDWEDAAIFYPRRFESRWRSWVTAAAYQRVMEALVEPVRTDS